MSKKMLCVTFSILLLVASEAGAQTSQQVGADLSSQFIRFLPSDQQWQGQLQASIVSYRNDAGVELDLVAAIHIADGQYYQLLNDYFTGRDAVLYELVADADVRPSGNIEDTGGGALSFIQRTMANFLQVDFQLQKIDYSPANFVHADLSPARLQEAMQARGENFFSMFLTLALAEMASQQQSLDQGSSNVSAINLISIIQALSAPDQNRAFKYLFAQELARSGGAIISVELENQVTILGERNQAALQVLDNTLSKSGVNKVSIFYGAAHMGGLERAILRDYGFQKVSQRWLAAWQIP